MLLSLAAMTRVRTEREASEAPACGGCGYALDGLALDTRCPECGVAAPRFRRASYVEIDARAPRFRRWLATAPLAALGIALVVVAAPHLVAWSYRVMGYPWETAYRATLAREYGLGRAPYGPEPTLFGSVSAAVMWPVVVVLVLSPLFAFLPRLRWAVLALGTGVLLASVVSVLIWTVPYV
jgi:hypothetical protein